MKKSWSLLQNDSKYKDLPIAYYACICHTLNLLFQDILKIKSSINIEDDAKRVVKDINNVHILKATLLNIQKSTNKVISLKMPVKTRWASLVSCLQSLIQNQKSLRKLAWSEDKHIIDKLGDLKLLILDFSFWNKIDQILNIV